MSSTILYLAIVAIWAGVLVPRWLRREPHNEGSSRTRHAARRSGRHADAHPDGTVDPATGDADALGRGAPHVTEAGAAVPADAGSGERPPDAGSGERPPDASAGGLRTAPPGQRRDRARRARVITARRRLLAMLALLLAVAMAVAAAGLAAWWVILPPAGMLAGYVALLREAARADAEPAQTRRAARTGRADVRWAPGMVAGPEIAADEVIAHAPAAQVFDLTQRVSEEIYDQYADAKLRAVGD